MTDLPAMMLWTDAYLGDTTHLTTFEHGAYLLILMAMWRGGGTLPDDDVMLSRCARTTLDRWRKIAPTIRAFLTADGSRLTQKRLGEELSRCAVRRQNFSERGRSGGLAKALKNNNHDRQQASAKSSIQNQNQKDSSLRSESSQAAKAASSSAGQNDPMLPLLTVVENKSKAIIRAENDYDRLDKITDRWNPWAATHRAKQVKALTDKRAAQCRRTMAALMKLEGVADPEEAFRRLLARCEESFFYLGNPKSPLTFDQLMTEDFMARMITGEFRYEVRKVQRG